MIEFYVLSAIKNQQSLLTICHLIEKWFNQKKQLYIHVADNTSACELDNLLWTYHPERFLPHKIYQSEAKTNLPITIGYMEDPKHNLEYIVNLADEVPPFYQKSQQIMEFVFAGQEHQTQARKRYKHYKIAGFEIKTTKLPSQESI